MGLLKIEWKRWTRSHKFFILLFVFLFTGVTSPVMTYYIRDIIVNLSPSTMGTMTFPEPTWQSLLLAYFKNTSQISLFVSLYMICDMSFLGKSDALRLFYKTRTDRITKLYLPKIIMGLIMISIASAVGQLTALYMIWVFFSHLPLGQLLLAFLLEWLAIVSLSLFTVCLALHLKSPFLAAFILEFFVMLAIFLSQASFAKWLPTQLLYQTDINLEHLDWGTLSSLWTLLGLVLVSGLGLYLLKSFKSSRKFITS